MVASPTTKKRPKKFNRKLFEQASKRAAAETLADLMATMLDNWTKTQLNQLSVNQEFVCIDMGKNIYRIGKFNVRKRNEISWTVSDSFGKLIHDFYNKQAAVFFCLYETRNQFSRASEFLHYNIDLASAQQQVEYYTAKIRTAAKKKDDFKQDLYIARLSDVRPKLEMVQTNLQKSIYAAKYSKVWETKS